MPIAAEGKTYLGGATWPRQGGSWFGRASWPLVRLTIHPEGITFGPCFPWMSWAIPTIDLRWQDIESVSRRRTGILIERTDKREGKILFQLNRDAILGDLSLYPVSIR